MLRQAVGEEREDARLKRQALVGPHIPVFSQLQRGAVDIQTLDRELKRSQGQRLRRKKIKLKHVERVSEFLESEQSGSCSVRKSCAT